MEGKKNYYYRTKLCGTWETQGKCDYDNCKRAHGPEELQIQFQKPCRFYAEGKCKKGDKCMYLHEGTIVEQSQTELAQPSCSSSHEPSLPPSLDHWPLLTTSGHATVPTPSWLVCAPASVPAPAAPSPGLLPLIPGGHAHLQSPSWPVSALASVTTPTPVSPPLPVSVSVPVPVPNPMAAPVSVSVSVPVPVPVPSASAATQVALSTAATTTTTVTAPENATSGCSIHFLSSDFTAHQISQVTNSNVTEEDMQGYVKNLRKPTHSKFLPFE